MASLTFFPKLFAFIDGKWLIENAKAVTWIEPRARVVEFTDAVSDDDPAYPFNHNAVARMVDDESEHDVVLILGGGRPLPRLLSLEHFLAQPTDRPDRVCRFKARFFHSEVRAAVDKYVEHVYRVRGARSEFV